jgi:hypothetical protein
MKTPKEIAELLVEGATDYFYVPDGNLYRIASEEVEGLIADAVQYERDRALKLATTLEFYAKSAAALGFYRDAHKGPELALSALKKYKEGTE